jgi:hypothetical protein
MHVIGLVVQGMRAAVPGATTATATATTVVHQ